MLIVYGKYMKYGCKVQWCRSWRCKHTPRSFDLPKIWAWSQTIRAKKFQHLKNILMKLYSFLLSVQMKLYYVIDNALNIY